MVTRGFFGPRRPRSPRPLPPGQRLASGFPVLSAEPTPEIPLDRWSFSIEAGGREMARWSWEEFLALPQEAVSTDIHCVTKWSRLDTDWRGVSIDALLNDAGIEPPTEYAMATTHTGYTTNLPVADITGGKAWVAWEYDGKPLPPEHGGPARLLVPHLYFWKSAKWVRSLRFIERDAPGFWEQGGYHMRGDPWKEQRYQGD